MANLVLKVSVALLLLLHGVAAQAQGRTDENPDGRQKIQEMKVEAPVTTEEDQHGYNMPERYMCDACQAVVYHLNQTLVRKHPKNRRFKEWEYTELFDEICANEFEGYGIKFMNGQNVLSGPALKARDDKFLQPGGAMIQMGGENWKKRMGEICRRFIYDEVGEEELYNRFYRGGELSPETLCFEVTKDCKKGEKKETKKSAEKKTGSSSKKTEKPEKTEKVQQEKGATKTSKKGFAASLSEGLVKKGLVKRETTKGDAGRAIDVTYFLAQLAVKHGLEPKDYTKARTMQEWEKTMVGLAGRIFAGQGTGETTSQEKDEKADEEVALEV